mgnify:FL=1
MEHHTAPERTIYLKPLFWEFVRRWRQLLIFMLIGALLLGGYTATKKSGSSISATVQADTQKQIDDTNDQISDYEITIRDNARKIESNQLLIADKKAEIQSQNEQIDRYNEYIQDCQQSREEARAVLGRLDSDVAIALRTQISALTDSIRNAQNAIAECNRSIRSYQSDIRSLENANEYTLPEENAKIEREILQLKEDVEELSKKLEPVSTAPGKKKIVMFAVVGAILGVFVQLLVLFVRVLFTHTLQSADEITANYPVSALGSLHEVKPKHRAALDRWAARHMSSPDAKNPDEAYRMIAAKLQVQAGSGAEILLTGTVAAAQLQLVCSALQKHLTDCAVRAVGDPSHDPNATAALRQQNVVIVESRGVSDVRAIDCMMNVLELCGAHYLGLIEI